MYHRVRKKAVKKQLILVSVLNIVTFLCFVFAIAYYEWIWIKLPYKGQYDSDAI